MSQNVVRKYISKLHSLFKEYRAKLHAHYKRSATLEEAHANPAPRIEHEADWEHLCDK